MPYLTYLFFVLYSSNIQYSALSGVPMLKQDPSPPQISNLTEAGVSDFYNLNQINFEDSLLHLYNAIGLKNYDLSFEVFRYGMIGFYRLQQQGKISDRNLLSIIDFTKSSCKKRFYTIDLDGLQLKYYTYVSHGKNTGEDLAKKFSNTVHSNQSSLGFYITAETYVGNKGYSLKLDGMEEGYNDKLRERAVVMHDAEYVSEYWIKHYGRLGRSQGCPALPKEISREVIDVIKNRTVIFAYYDDLDYLKKSSYLNLDQLLTQYTITAKLTK